MEAWLDVQSSVKKRVAPAAVEKETHGGPSEFPALSVCVCSDRPPPPGYSI